VLEQIVGWRPDLRASIEGTRAEFLLSQFGVQTLANYGGWFGRQPTDDPTADTGTFALHTLAENETIARLATGVRRLELPDEHNPIKIYQQLRDDATDDDVAMKLAEIFENRRQYDRAADILRQCMPNPVAAKLLEPILGNWGRFEQVMTQPSGRGATVDFRFRNGKRVEFTARKIDVPQLLKDVQAYLAASPNKLSWDELQVENLGYRLVTQGQEKYLGEEVARWSLDLEPLAKHFDRRTTVTTPLQEPGAYLLTSQMVDGNSTSIVLWLSDTAIVRKPLSGKSLYYVADAISGKPIEQCNVEFFGYRQQPLEGNKFQVHTKNFAKLTDHRGLLELPGDELPNDDAENRRFQWLATATTPEGRFAYLGFHGVWGGDDRDSAYRQVKVFAITDRPVYRPEQLVHFKFWVRNARYDLDDESRFALQSFQIEIRDPQNEKVHSSQMIADALGGLEGEWQIPAGATLGQYRVNVVNHGGGTFRVEEYKKPEFEVTVDAPSSPVQLGDKITATISAKYYFGSPVTNATVSYKVLRTSYDQNWYPPMPWDWLYGSGYGWLTESYSWYSGWARWGCSRPQAWWLWRTPNPPEVIAQQEVAIGADGTVQVEIDTATAKQFHPDQDHAYQIEVEVVDQSRRTIVGSGRVLVAREPFRVFVWTDHGYYRAGDTIEVSATARTLDGEPVAGTGALRLLQIRYEDGKPVETEVGQWELSAADEQATLQIKASEPGRYRLSYEVTDAAGHTNEGGQILTVAGVGFDGSEFRFNDIELVADRRDYRPGEKVALQINTNRTGAAVLLFLRPTDGVYLEPQLIELDGKSKIVEFEVTAADTPNFFVEAVTIHGGKVHSTIRELFVPPVSRLLHVEVVPSAEAYLPGQEAKISLKVTNHQGEPFVGSLAMTVYDKAVEYIAGGSNVADIREFFWKWRRSHQTRGDHNLGRYGQNFVKDHQPSMQNLGLFGGTVVDELEIRRSRSRLDVGGEQLSMGFAVNEKSKSDMDGAILMEAESAANPILPHVRENFADTALWVGSLETNAEGIAEVEFELPESLTTWKARVWAMGHGTRVGEGTAEVVTRKNLLVRLQAPRFFVERDEVVLSANVHNYLPTAKQVTVRLDLEGNTLDGPQQLEQTIEIKAGGEQRVDWRVIAAQEGTAIVRVSAITDEESDAMQMSFPVHVHGMLKTDSFTGVIRGNQTRSQFEIVVPAERRAEQTTLEIRYTPTLAGAMVDALPYLIDYPYGCTEQTLNRFLPAVLAQQTLRRMGLDLDEIREKRTNLNSQEVGDDAERAKRWRRYDRSPVFNEAELEKIVAAGVNRLTQMQLADGGWGWFSGWGEQSSAHTTAVVMHGLLVAKANGAAIVPRVVDRGVTWLDHYQSQQLRLIDNWQKYDKEGKRIKPNKPAADNTDALVTMVLAEAGRDNPRMRDYLYRDRTKLAVYSLATFGLALHHHGDAEKLAMVMQNLGQYVRQDDENQTAWLELPGGSWWNWYGSEYEAQAYYLKLLAATDPTSDIAPRLVKYLLNNRRHATYWKSTRDTALVVEAFADYLEATGEGEPDAVVEIWIDGQRRKQVTITRDNLFTFDNKLVLTGGELSTGRHVVEIRKQGDSPIYFSGYLTNFTLQDDIRAVGLELKVDRRYFKLTPIAQSTEVAGGRGQVVGQQVEKYERTALVNLAELTSGDLVEVELIVDSKNDYEYILLEDMKAAGLEPVALRSGYNGNELGAYMEVRDDRVSLFVARLARGRHSLSYRLRAEIPGQFSALPTRASAMYAPELRANSDEMKLRIVD